MVFEINTNEFKNMKESRRHGDELLPIVQYCIGPEDGFSSVDCHWHSEMELFRVMHGTVTMQCGTSLFEAHEGERRASPAEPDPAGHAAVRPDLARLRHRLHAFAGPPAVL